MMSTTLPPRCGVGSGRVTFFAFALLIEHGKHADSIVRFVIPRSELFGGKFVDEAAYA